MSVAGKKVKMRRTQISLTAEDYDVVKKLATKRGESLSQVIRDALRKEAAAEDISYDPLGAIIGIVENADPNASENVDETVYGRSIR